MAKEEKNKKESLNFIEQIIVEHNENGRFGGRVHTRFPPEPNGYLHIGHAKAICVNFGIAEKFGGKTNLRFDDTNPETESTEFVEGIKRDIKWLGFDWEDREYFASDYFQTLYDYAVKLIKDGLAYVDFSDAATMDKEKKAGQESAYRNRSVEENLSDFEKMKDGEYEEGKCVLRAKIDMNHVNWLMRDPILYRIKRMAHHRTGDKWNIYPMYDLAHGQSDSIEEITHSLCSLEFLPHRELYDWLVEKLGIYAPQQIEFSRLNLNYTITSKRKLRQLVEEGHVAGWDDPRMPTLTGMRRRGFTPAAIRNFIEKAGVSKREQQIDLSLLEFCVREDLNKVATRALCVLDPLKVVITNFEEVVGSDTKIMSVENNPEEEDSGSHEIPFSKEIYIEKTDFKPNANKKYFRMTQGRNVRLKGACIVHCDDYVADDEGNVIEVHCSIVENSWSGEDTSGVKPKGTLHWVSIKDAVEVEVRQYDRLFAAEAPGKESGNFLDDVNPESLVVIEKAYAEPFLKEATAGDRYQFMRIGYFCLDEDSTEDHLIFNRTIGLRDNWKKKG
jgi:glutaminyl-tRNA synthetase